MEKLYNNACHPSTLNLLGCHHMRLSQALEAKKMDLRLRDKLVHEGKLTVKEVQNYFNPCPMTRTSCVWLTMRTTNKTPTTPKNRLENLVKSRFRHLVKVLDAPPIHSHFEVFDHNGPSWKLRKKMRQTLVDSLPPSPLLPRLLEPGRRPPTPRVRNFPVPLPDHGGVSLFRRR